MCQITCYSSFVIISFPSIFMLGRFIIRAPILYHQPRFLYGSFLSASYSLDTLVLGPLQQRHKSHILVSCIFDTQARQHPHLGHSFHPCIYRRRLRTVGGSHSLDRRGWLWGVLLKGFEERMKAGLVGPNTHEETIGERVLEWKLRWQRLEGEGEKVVENAQQQTAFDKSCLE